MLTNRLTLLVAVTFTLCLQSQVFAQERTDPVVLDPIRIVAGESCIAELKGERLSIGSITSTRITPQLDFPFRFEVITESGIQSLRLIAPPATPAGDYTIDLTGILTDSRPLTATFRVTIDPIIVPFSTRPPVILLNGWQFSCSNSTSTLKDSEETFGLLHTQLESDGATVLFFNNCFYGVIPIEQLGDQLRIYITNLHYPDGTPVTEVDLVGHSMGGLIARAYLSGKSEISGTFIPPAKPKVRKLITIATPHFGSFQAWNLGVQSPQMTLGSQFLWDLATWNQGRDDLRGVDALAIIGNAGDYYTPSNADDGVVSLTSGSIGFAVGITDQRTRIVPYCHTSPWLFSWLGMSCSKERGIADIDNSSHQTAKIVRSFLADTTAWQSVGTTPSQDPFLKQYGGRVVALKGSNDEYFRDLTNVEYKNAASVFWSGHDNSVASIYYDEFIGSGSYDVVLDSAKDGALSSSDTVLAGLTRPALFKVGPLITSVTSSESFGLPGLTLPSGSTITLKGFGFTSSTTLSADGARLTVSKLSDTEITATLPSSYDGLVKLAVSTANGKSSTNIFVAPPPTTSTNPSFEITMSKTSYSNGDTVTASVFGPRNPSTSAAAVKLRVWLKVPTVGEITLIQLGSDGSFSLPANLNVNLGPLSLFKVDSSFPPKGNWEFNSRIENPKTGVLLNERLNPFVIQ